MEKDEKEFRKLLRKVERDYFENRKEAKIDMEKLDQVIKEIDSFDLVGDEVIWLN